MYYQRYQENVTGTLNQIFTQETAKIEQAGSLLAQTLEQDGLLYVFGNGHSHMLAEELFYRAGGLAPVCPIVSLEYFMFSNVSVDRSSSRICSSGMPCSIR